MKKVFNECVGCTAIGLPCLGSACSFRNVTRLFCDWCGEETDILYEGECGEELCEECELKSFEDAKIVCSECGNDEALYEYEGKNICYCCLLGKREKGE